MEEINIRVSKPRTDTNNGIKSTKNIKKITIIKETLKNKGKESFNHRDITKPQSILKAIMKIFILRREKYENRDWDLHCLLKKVISMNKLKIIKNFTKKNRRESQNILAKKDIRKDREIIWRKEIRITVTKIIKIISTMISFTTTLIGDFKIDDDV